MDTGPHASELQRILVMWAMARRVPPYGHRSKSELQRILVMWALARVWTFAQKCAAKDSCTDWAPAQMYEHAVAEGLDG